MNDPVKAKTPAAPPRVIISGGGTGGHVFPAIAIADAVKAIHPEAALLFVGAKGKLEMEKVPKAGYKIQGLWISGFHRKLTLRNLSFPFKLLSSLWKAGQIIRQFKPDIAIGVGGFASGPLLYMASRKGIATLIQEQNSFPGVTNRLLANRVEKACVAYTGMERFFPREKIILTGNPVRNQIQNSRATKEQGAQHFGLDPQRPILFVTGGSLGAQSINEAMAANANLLAEHSSLQVLWQHGKLYEESFGNCATAQLPNVKAVSFVDRMELAYAMSDVIISRSGALTIAELQFAGKPAIFIPSPNVAEDHQRKNAMALVEKEAAWIIDNERAGEEIIRKVLELLEDTAEQKKLSENIKKLAMPDAARSIAEEALQLLDRR